MNNEYQGTDSTAARTVPMGGAYANQDQKLSNDDVVSTMNDLIETCRDGQEGFQQAAEAINDSELKTLFYEYSQQRAQFGAVLMELVRELGGDPTHSGSTAGALHRGWMDLKSAITGGSEESILNEAERGEDSAKDAYKDALEKNLPANIADVVRQQATAVQAAHNRVRELRNAESRAAS